MKTLYECPNQTFTIKIFPGKKSIAFTYIFIIILNPIYTLFGVGIHLLIPFFFFPKKRKIKI